MLAMVRRAIAYIDGFNLYKGCLEGTSWRWLDLVGLMDSLAGRQCSVRHVNYFTAMVNDRPDDAGQSQRQDVFLRALQAHCGDRLTIALGRFATHAVKKRLVKPSDDGAQFAEVWHTTEKASDVNLGAHLVWDACNRNMDTAIVVSNDSDLQTPVDLAMKCGCNVVTVNPQMIDRRARRVRKQYPHLFGSETRNLSVGRLRRNLLPDPVTGADGEPIYCPPSWLRQP
jgi:hypothetical protein